MCLLNEFRGEFLWKYEITHNKNLHALSATVVQEICLNSNDLETNECTSPARLLMRPNATLGTCRSAFWVYDLFYFYMLIAFTSSLAEHLETNISIPPGLGLDWDDFMTTMCVCPCGFNSTSTSKLLSCPIYKSVKSSPGTRIYSNSA